MISNITHLILNTAKKLITLQVEDLIALTDTSDASNAANIAQTFDQTLFLGNFYIRHLRLALIY